MRLEMHLGCLLVFGSALLIGCAGNPPADGEHADHGDESAEQGHEEEHEGPHGGHVVELGRSHEYHAELVDDEAAKAVTVYILDKDLKPLPVDSQVVTLNLSVDGQAQSIELAAAAPMNGKASQFASSDDAAFNALHVKEATGKLSVTIDGVPYSGDIEHHDHDEHH